jgi:hypothetical protein
MRNASTRKCGECYQFYTRIFAYGKRGAFLA